MFCYLSHLCDSLSKSQSELTAKSKWIACTQEWLFICLLVCLFVCFTVVVVFIILSGHKRIEIGAFQ